MNMTATSLPRQEKSVGSFLAGAVGDALGWPFEGRARRVQAKGRQPGADGQAVAFLNWMRSGSRSQPYREPIAAGEYSDDTQLLLCTARSILHGKDWWEHFAFVELPSWQTYERGGGGATRRAAQSWLAGKPPWESPQTRQKYFQAGGNGVAMRILPHLLSGDRRKDASHVSKQILTNGLCTHGHPRALVGALLHGMSVRLSLQQEGMLEFGALTAAVRQGLVGWAQLKDLPAIWQHAFSNSELRAYRGLWEQTIRECIDLIEIAEDGLRLGPLSAGPETLHRMGALNPRTNGSGTITAAAALFLASRYAASPLQGIQVAAGAVGADTDTLASMCGSILGAIHGDEWLGHLATSVQDSSYIRKITVALDHKSAILAAGSVSPVTSRDCRTFQESLGSLTIGEKIQLPDRRGATVRRIDPMFSESSLADLCVIEADDGQTLAVRRVARKGKTSPSLKIRVEERILRVGIKVFVTDLARAKEFYVGKLRFPIMKEYANGFTVAEVISIQLVKADAQRTLSLQLTCLPAPTPTIRVANIEAVASRLSLDGVAVEPVVGNRSIKGFRVSDPFGNRLEFFEAHETV